MAFKISIILKFLEFQEPFFKKVLGASLGRASHKIKAYRISCAASPYIFTI